MAKKVNNIGAKDPKIETHSNNDQVGSVTPASDPERFTGLAKSIRPAGNIAVEASIGD